MTTPLPLTATRGNTRPERSSMVTSLSNSSVSKATTRAFNVSERMGIDSRTATRMDPTTPMPAINDQIRTRRVSFLYTRTMRRTLKQGARNRRRPEGRCGLLKGRRHERRGTLDVATADVQVRHHAFALGIDRNAEHAEAGGSPQEVRG